MFRSLDQVGDDAFIEAIAQVSLQSLDRSILQNQAKLGDKQNALEQFNMLKAFKYQPTWWQLAYNFEETLIGLIMPTENDGGVTIGYIGVVPEHRGKGYVNDLLKPWNPHPQI